jgi:membrane fusion protein (multidrug efflux system)
MTALSRANAREKEHCEMTSRNNSTASVACLLLAVAACSKSAPPPPPPPDVVVADVVQKDVPIYAEWVGTTEGNITAQIRARVQGYLQSREYTEGRLVRAGDLLFVIDPRPYQAAYDQAKADVSRAEAALGKAQQDVTRYTPLVAEKAVSQQELDNAVQASRAGKAMVDAARAALDKAKLNLDWTQVKSPIDGIAGISVAQVGDLIGENTQLTTISQVDPIKVSFPISEQEYLRFADQIDLNSVTPREPKLELILADGAVYPERGRASVANREVDVQTGTMMIVALFPNSTNLVRPGQYAKVRAHTETRSAALLIPQRAVQELQGAYQVAVVGADNKVAMRPVKAGERIGDLWVIHDGLKAGERVVVDGLQKVREGATVNPKLATVAAAEPTPAAKL